MAFHNVCFFLGNGEAAADLFQGRRKPCASQCVSVVSGGGHGHSAHQSLWPLQKVWTAVRRRPIKLYVAWIVHDFAVQSLSNDIVFQEMPKLTAVRKTWATRLPIWEPWGRSDVTPPAAKSASWSLRYTDRHTFKMFFFLKAARVRIRFFARNLHVLVSFRLTDVLITKCTFTTWRWTPWRTLTSSQEGPPVGSHSQRKVRGR